MQHFLFFTVIWYVGERPLFCTQFLCVDVLEVTLAVTEKVGWRVTLNIRMQRFELTGWTPKRRFVAVRLCN